jgi:hypothetical protein
MERDIGCVVEERRIGTDRRQNSTHAGPDGTLAKSPWRASPKGGSRTAAG